MSSGILLFPRLPPPISRRPFQDRRVERVSPSFRGGLPKELARLGKTGVGFGQGQTLEQLQLLSTAQIKDGVARANAGELVHDATQGTLLVNTARSQAFAGFKPKQPVRLANLELALENAFAVVIVTALDDLPISSSKRMLVSALVRVNSV